MMMFVLPFIFVPFVISFPAGLVLYWITTNVWTIGQQYTIQKLIPAPVAADARRTQRQPRRRKPPLRRREKEEAAVGAPSGQDRRLG